MSEHEQAPSDEEDTEGQIEMMREWFFERFEDPAERTPYESAEGGYIWIWGGPYDAQEVLGDEFGGTVSDALIEELVGQLERECVLWAPKEKPGDYDDPIYDDVGEISEYHHIFTAALESINALLHAPDYGSAEACFCRVLYGNVITVLETYLSDAFMNTVVADPKLLRRLVESTPRFKDEKISLSEIFKAGEQIEMKAKAYLADLLWHNFSRVRPMYWDVLNIGFGEDQGDLERAILKRHDLVHRNGKTKAGLEIIVSRADVAALIEVVKRFVGEIDEKIQQFKVSLAIAQIDPPDIGWLL
jgi:hypothetical protein